MNDDEMQDWMATDALRGKDGTQGRGWRGEPR